eukprot:CAMPEP_0183443362 /NCGR_PEP_ID=MMETSP0370-20130417/91526_1 /TAXON_ID=268820 /ORGANISM="Peridinium aciculiferum, Strain PAER-2" /LENGTH=45 /DNA_ID= /DNA_START= /DNA_END= /DNA_ORIENTATION=
MTVPFWPIGAPPGFGRCVGVGSLVVGAGVGAGVGAVVWHCGIQGM